MARGAPGIRCIFNAVMDPMATEVAIRLTRERDDYALGTQLFWYSGGTGQNEIVEAKPGIFLEAETTYRVVVKTTARTLHGFSLADSAATTFTTGRTITAASTRPASHPPR